MFTACTRCDQTMTTTYGEYVHGAEPMVCDTCRKAEREPQGEAVRLFTPAPTQLDGQLSL